MAFPIYMVKCFWFCFVFFLWTTNQSKYFGWYLDCDWISTENNEWSGQNFIDVVCPQHQAKLCLLQVIN